jgi:membrane fusion protein (multidrug efflux system)
MTEQQSVWCGRIGLGIGVAFAWLLCAACAYAQMQGPTTAVPVGVVVDEKQPVARSAEFVGRIEAPSRVEVRARVTGYLDAVLFKEGERVREGDLLYRIDQAPFQAAVQQAQGALLRAQASHTNASRQDQRHTACRTGQACG